MATNGETATYRQVDAESHRIAPLFHSLDLKADDRVAIYLESDSALLRLCGGSEASANQNLIDCEPAVGLV